MIVENFGTSTFDEAYKFTSKLTYWINFLQLLKSYFFHPFRGQKVTG